MKKGGVSKPASLPSLRSSTSSLFEHKNIEVGVVKSLVFSLLFFGNFEKMVQQLSKSGARDTPELKAGHPPAGKTFFLHNNYQLLGFFLHIQTKRCCSAQHDACTESCTQKVNNVFSAFLSLKTYSLLHFVHMHVFYV